MNLEEKLQENIVIRVSKFSEQNLITQLRFFWVLVTHAYNPSYSGGRNQEDLSLKYPA
jgi:hypothetical protein